MASGTARFTLMAVPTAKPTKAIAVGRTAALIRIKRPGARPTPPGSALPAPAALRPPADGGPLSGALFQRDQKRHAEGEHQRAGHEHEAERVGQFVRRGRARQHFDRHAGDRRPGRRARWRRAPPPPARKTASGRNWRRRSRRPSGAASPRSACTRWRSGTAVPRPAPTTNSSSSTSTVGIEAGQIDSAASARIASVQADERHALVMHHMRHQPAGDGGEHHGRAQSAGSAPGRIGSPTDASPPRNKAARKSSCRPASPWSRRRRARRSAPPDWPAPRAAETAPPPPPAARRTGPTAPPRSPAARRTRAEIQSKRRPPQDSASSSATAAAIISAAPITSSWCLRGRNGTRLNTFEVMPSAARPSGRLIQKISDQSRCCGRESRRAPARRSRRRRTPRRYSPGSGRARAGETMSAMMVCASAISPPPPSALQRARKHQRGHARRQRAGERAERRRCRWRSASWRAGRGCRRACRRAASPRWR